MPRRVRLELLGPHTRVVADLCAACPSGPLGCCSQPPDLSWADVARVASLGGVAWLIGEMESGRLRRGPRGLVVERAAAGSGGEQKCVYHGDTGCTISPDRRSAACNYYVCPEALAEAGEDTTVVEAASAAWTAQYHAWVEVLSSEIGREGEGLSEGGERRLFEALARRFGELAAPSPGRQAGPGSGE